MTRTLVVDIGGTGIKEMVLDDNGVAVNEYTRMRTPLPGTPEVILGLVESMRVEQPAHSRISVGFPGVVKKGVVYNAPNLGNEYWSCVPLADMIESATGLPTRVLNDADLQGLGVATGNGVELVLTLGTGLGAVLFSDGTLMPNIELGHHPFGDGRSYEDHVGDAELKAIGSDAWSDWVRRVIAQLQAFFNYDRLYLGGGNLYHLMGELPNNVHRFALKDAMSGGHRLWEILDLR